MRFQKTVRFSAASKLLLIQTTAEEKRW